MEQSNSSCIYGATHSKQRYLQGKESRSGSNSVGPHVLGNSVEVHKNKCCIKCVAGHPKTCERPRNCEVSGSMKFNYFGICHLLLEYEFPARPWSRFSSLVSRENFFRNLAMRDLACCKVVTSFCQIPRI